MDILIPIVFPDYKIAAVGTTWSNLGHAGLLIILGSTGSTRYFEYGRYDKASLGLVKKRMVPDAKSVGGKVTDASLVPVLAVVAEEAGHGTRIAGAYILIAGGFQKALTYAQDRLAENTKTDREPYRLIMNNCADFMKGGIKASGLKPPIMIDPRPNSYIAELRDVYQTLDYDPKTKALVIGSAP